MKRISSFLFVLLLMLSSFTVGARYSRGDVNSDGFVNVVDVSSLIDYLLGDRSQTFNADNADVDLNGLINISDVTSLIDYLLHGIWPSEEPQPQTETFTVNGVSFTMVAVEGDTFTMGATAEQESDAFSGEKPAHQVTLSSYSIGQTEVTQELWQAVMGSNPSQFTGNLQHPVEKVTWNDCQTFLTELNQLTGKNFRLPTEAEWEFAARGGNQSKGYKYSGTNTISVVGWYDENSGSKTHPVASKVPNELGLYDMTGNVWEWCQDWHGNYSSDAQTDPVGPSTGTNRVSRGGSHGSYPRISRVSYRQFFSPTYVYFGVGLRLVL